MAILSDLAIRRIKHQPKEFTLKDGDGLFLNVHPNGSKYWLLRFSWNKKQTRLQLGKYPEMGLLDARHLRFKAREFLAKDIHPSELFNKTENIEIEETGIIFGEFAKTWLKFKLIKHNAIPSKEKKNGGRSGMEVQITRAFKNDLFPTLEHKALKDITRKDLLEIQKKIEKRNALSTSEKVRGWLNEMFRYAVAMGELEVNPASDLDVAALPYRRNNHYPYLEMEDIPELMAKIPNYKGMRQTILALKLLLLTGVRTGELRFSEPWQFELDKKIWRIPAEDVKQLQNVKKTKDNKVPDYIVPLSNQAMAIVNELFSMHMPGQRYLLGHRTLPQETISENTLNQALKRMGFARRLCPHGMRATISTALNEKRYHEDFIEAQLSHKGKNKVRATYNHAKYIELRRKMMQDWADMLDEWEKEGSNVPTS